MSPVYECPLLRDLGKALCDVFLGTKFCGFRLYRDYLDSVTKRKLEPIGHETEGTS